MNDDPKLIRHPLRLIMRAHGDWWVASLSGDDERKARPIAKILMGAVVDESLRARYLELMTDIVGKILEETTGEKPAKFVVMPKGETPPDDGTEH